MTDPLRHGVLLLTLAAACGTEEGSGSDGYLATAEFTPPATCTPIVVGAGLGHEVFGETP
jgi:hypothetical protein